MKKWIVSIFLLLLTSLLVLAFWLNMDMQRKLNQPLAINSATVLEVKPGQSLTSLAKNLVESGWIAQPYYFIFEGRRQKKAGSLKVGEYTIEPGTTPLELLDILVAGKVRQYALTIPEGLTFTQILELIWSDSRIKQTLKGLTPEKIMEEIGYSGHFAEGRVFPDTYLFPAATSDVDFLRRAVDMQEKVLQEEWQKREASLPYHSAYEALIMASIIEKETALPEEREKIAGVFVRRLMKNMKLQTDPTVIYAMAESFEGNIKRKDLRIDSPYNTYVYRGLPPTPIASPGREAIYAALHPEPGKSLYFVSRGDGSHQFSETLKEHNRAVARFQLKRKR